MAKKLTKAAADALRWVQLMADGRGILFVPFVVMIVVWALMALLWLKNLP